MYESLLSDAMELAFNRRKEPHTLANLTDEVIYYIQKTSLDYLRILLCNVHGTIVDVGTNKRLNLTFEIPQK